MQTVLGNTGQPEVEQSKTPSQASSDIGVWTLMAERSRWSADGNEELTGVSDQKCRAARLGTPAWYTTH